MMTTNLFAIANVKQLWTYVVLEFYCLFFPNVLVCWRPKFSNFFNGFHNRVEFGTIFWRAFGISEGVWTPEPHPQGTPLLIAKNTFFEPCIVVYLCNKNQQNAHFLH